MNKNIQVYNMYLATYNYGMYLCIYFVYKVMISFIPIQVLTYLYFILTDELDPLYSQDCRLPHPLQERINLQGQQQGHQNEPD